MPTPFPFNLDEEIGRQRRGPYGGLMDKVTRGELPPRALTPMVNDSTYEARVVVAHMLHRHARSNEAVQILLRLVDDDNAYVRWAAVWSLGFSSRNEEVVTRLLEVTQDDCDVDVRLEAERSYRKIEGSANI